jgi:hypothetical protein
VPGRRSVSMAMATGFPEGTVDPNWAGSILPQALE